MTTTQLRLATETAPWQLDPTTRRIGRAGIASARAQLAATIAASDETKGKHLLAADEHALAA